MQLACPMENTKTALEKILKNAKFSNFNLGFWYQIKIIKVLKFEGVC